MIIGVLALQGAVREHLSWLEKAGVEGRAIKRPQDLETIDGLIIPGGESTAISRLINENQLFEPIQAFAKQKPIMGTCAGLILCAKEIQQSDQAVKPLGLIDITVERNGFGRQIDSFEVYLDVKNMTEKVLSVFIRAPYIVKAGDGVNVLAEIDGKIVMAEQGKVLVCAFHPELTDDIRILQYFLRQ